MAEGFVVDNVVGRTFTADEVKGYIVNFFAMVDVAVSWFPAAASKIVPFLAQVKVLTAQQWFVDILTYLLNTFGNKVPTGQEVAEALEHFAKHLGVVGSVAPVKFVKE